MNEKGLKLTPKLTKTPKVSKSQSFHAFLEFSTDFVDWNVENVHRGKNLLSSSLL